MIGWFLSCIFLLQVQVVELQIVSGCPKRVFASAGRHELVEVPSIVSTNQKINWPGCITESIASSLYSVPWLDISGFSRFPANESLRRTGCIYFFRPNQATSLHLRSPVRNSSNISVVYVDSGLISIGQYVSRLNVKVDSGRQC